MNIFILITLIDSCIVQMGLSPEDNTSQVKIRKGKSGEAKLPRKITEVQDGQGAFNVTWDVATFFTVQDCPEHSRTSSVPANAHLYQW